MVTETIRSQIGLIQDTMLYLTSLSEFVYRCVRVLVHLCVCLYASVFVHLCVFVRVWNLLRVCECQCPSHITQRITKHSRASFSNAQTSQCSMVSVCTPVEWNSFSTLNRIHLVTGPFSQTNK